MRRQYHKVLIYGSKMSTSGADRRGYPRLRALESDVLRRSARGQAAGSAEPARGVSQDGVDLTRV